MSHKIRAHMTGNGTADWRVEFADTGAYICDIRLSISSMLNGSHYYILQDGNVVQDGTFNFGVWDWAAVRDVMTKIVRSMYANASVEVVVPQASGQATGS